MWEDREGLSEIVTWGYASDLTSLSPNFCQVSSQKYFEQNCSRCLGSEPLSLTTKLCRCRSAVCGITNGLEGPRIADYCFNLYEWLAQCPAHNRLLSGCRCVATVSWGVQLGENSTITPNVCCRVSLLWSTATDLEDSRKRSCYCFLTTLS